MGKIAINIEKPYPKQIEFFKLTNKYVAYGGARGGGKSWSARIKCVLLALNYAGIQILLLRRTFPELRENHVIPLIKLLKNVADYKVQDKTFTFPNGSRIVLGYCNTEADVLQYQGQAYDVIFMEEATQFTEFQFQTLTESNRSSGLCKDEFKPRMYFTCNPSGVGHMWVKRLFIDRKYTKSERPEDYAFVKSLVYENEFLMKNSPEYVRTLENLPEERRKAMLYGDWDIFEGQYFPEFDETVHVVKPFQIPHWWTFYRVFDYGLDMLACYIVAVDEQSRAYVISEIYEPNLIISEASKKMLDTPYDIFCTYAPPDMWGRSQETGKSKADIFAEHGLYITKAKNDRIAGWFSVKEYLKTFSDEVGEKRANLAIFNTCRNLIRCLPSVITDPKNPNDINKEPHELTHSLDALRYYCVMRPIEAVKPLIKDEDYIDYDDEIENFVSYSG